MASSSSSSPPRTWRYRVFTSFHGPDVREAFHGHLRKQFSCHGISMFDDQGMERGQTITPSLTQAIRESRIAVIVFTKNYASSSGCLDELVEIFKCNKHSSQEVMTVFYGVDPCDVRNQVGDFGKDFKKTCARKPEEKRRKWTKALTKAANIAGEHFLNWDNESKMIEKIARDVSNKLNATVSSDFEDMVGMEAHLQKMQSLLDLKYEDEAMTVGICGPAGIGKTTIARALHSRFSSGFQLSYFMENLRGSDNSSLHEQLLSNILNQDGNGIDHLGAIPDMLCDKKVFIILDDVDDLQQLDVLANEANWFGPGSRIIITTEDQNILEQHGIDNIYHVDFPNEEEARSIFCRYAFIQSSAPDGFDELVERVTKICSKLPLGLRVMGSSLRRKKGKEWEYILRRLENSLSPNMEGVLKVGYDTLHEKDQFLFLLIAFFFNYEADDHLIAMLDDSSLDVGRGLKTLAYKSLIQKSTRGKIVMHKLLQQVGRQAVQSQEPWERQFLTDSHEICDVLETESGNKSVTGISFDTSTIPYVVNISKSAFKDMSNLRFLSIYNTSFDRDNRVHVPKDMDFPPLLKLLHWEAYPGKCLPPTFRPDYLVELNLQNNELEKLWDGTQALANLKKIDLEFSLNLKELPDLSNAKNLERLKLASCTSLVELPASIRNLHKLEELGMDLCNMLQAVPTLFNLTSLARVNMFGCRKLRKIPDFSKNITKLVVTDTMLEEWPESISHWSRLQSLYIRGSVNPYPISTKKIPQQSGGDIERIPDWIKDLHGLKNLYITGCPKLAYLPELPCSLIKLEVDNCESLETLMPFPFDSRIKDMQFLNCFRLGGEARKIITQQSYQACLPGRTMPAEFNHRAIGNSLTIRSGFSRFSICLVLSPKPPTKVSFDGLLCRIRIRINGCPADGKITRVNISYMGAQHIFIFPYEFFGKDKDGWLESEDNKISFKFITASTDVDVIECGVRILTNKTGWTYESCCSEQASEDKDDNESLYDGSNEFDEPRVKFFDGHSLSSLMASSSSSTPPRTWRYRVFASFHGPDVRKTFLAHLRTHFSCNGISMFDDQGIERGQTIASALILAIRESRIAIVVLTKNYASSSWCLNELVEIFKCKEGRKQIVMTIFYGVDPSDVQKQSGDFGKVFKKTCARKTKDEREKWRQALIDVSNIPGEHSRNWFDCFLV
ncbi:hypothetical protein AALP_AA3G061400 [Arabis alpina]|uniref:ADP-ribosyl cyclase/cyclic ADP-ribose hydrolase n=1 Tax=Arabis alpina TaxID=50452 RepID=A0A087H7C9_ARAAL|nr:hypothetical protein AALP_AA3G061400 [Arabis alpina]